MAKMLKDTELIDIITRGPEEIDDADQYKHFLEDLGGLVAEHFGSFQAGVSFRGDDDLGWMIAFEIDGCVPFNGGVFARYDTDVLWHDGVEVC